MPPGDYSPAGMRAWRLARGLKEGEVTPEAVESDGEVLHRFTVEALPEFLLARVSEDEVMARAALPGPWNVDSETYAEYISNADNIPVISGGRWGGEASVFNDTKDALHVARWDPARVLAEVEAKLKIIDRHARVRFGKTRCHSCWDLEAEFPCLTLKALAIPYTDHEDYREEWKL